MNITRSCQALWKVTEKLLIQHQKRMTSRFSGVELGPPVEIFALMKQCQDDPFEKKVDLSCGAYRTDEGKPWVLPVVRKVEQQMAHDETLNHEYLPVLGMDSLSSAGVKLLLGDDSKHIKEGKAFGVQVVSGSGALRVGADFLAQQLNYRTFYESVPTYVNHRRIFTTAGFTDQRSYRYWDAKKRGIDFEGMIQDLKAAPENSVIILHACAHNPTGCDPTQEQWVKIADVMEERKLFPFFDTAYQGFASGDLERDAWAVRHFASRGFEMICAQSFSKNFGIYNERAGNLTFVVNDPKNIPQMKSQLTLIIRGMYSNPPHHGGRIVATVLNNPQLFAEWIKSVRTMAERSIDMRKALKERLLRLGTPGTWDHITNQIGMFSYTGMTERQVEYLVKQYHIYLPKSGRISMVALTTKNLDYVANAMHDAITKFPA